MQVFNNTSLKEEEIEKCRMIRNFEPIFFNEPKEVIVYQHPSKKDYTIVQTTYGNKFLRRYDEISKEKMRIKT